MHGKPHLRKAVTISTPLRWNDLAHFVPAGTACSAAFCLSCTPFWWEYPGWINDSLVTNMMLFFSRFAGDVDLAHLSLEPIEITTGNRDAWAM